MLLFAAPGLLSFLAHDPDVRAMHKPFTFQRAALCLRRARPEGCVPRTIKHVLSGREPHSSQCSFEIAASLLPLDSLIFP